MKKPQEQAVGGGEESPPMICTPKVRQKNFWICIQNME